MTPQILSPEAVTRVDTLGMVFVDAVSGDRVAEGLEVTASVPGQPGTEVPAIASRARVFHFPALPGLAAAEHGMGDDAYWLSPVQREFQISVVDRLRRYRPWQFAAQAPARGHFMPGCLSGEYSPAAPTGIPLYFDAGASSSAAMATVRAELMLAATGKPAARAVMEVLMAGRRLGRGIADEGGKLVVSLPAPALQSFSSGSQLTAGTGRALGAQVWKVNIVVRYSAAAMATALPDPCTVLFQPEVPVWLSTDWTTSLPEQDLTLGRDLTLRSIDVARQTRSSQLWVGAHP